MAAMREARVRRLSAGSDTHIEYTTTQASRLFSSDNDMSDTSTVDVLRASSTAEHALRCHYGSKLLNSDSEVQLKGHVNRLLGSGDGHIQMKSRNYMMSPRKMGTKADGFERKGQAWFVATELQSDLVVEVGDITFNLHKFPLLSRSGRLNRLVFESRDTQKNHIRLTDMPGGPESFELAAKFCYGVAVDLTANCIAALRCAAEYLEMTEDLEDGNLISKTEAFLSIVVLASWKDSITVLETSENLNPWAENLQIIRRCTESIAWKACTDPRGISWSFTGRGGLNSRQMNNCRSTRTPLRDSPSQKNDPRRVVPHDWWIEDVSSLCVQYFVKVITAIRAKGMRPDLVASAVAQYALKWIPGLDKDESNLNVSSMQDGSPTKVSAAIHANAFTNLQTRNRGMLESLVTILPNQKDSLSCSFLLRILRMANMLNASLLCRKELERRVGLQLDQASLADLLIPSFNHTNETLFDVDLVHRVVENFLMQEQASPQVNANLLLNGYSSASEQRGDISGTMSVQNAKVKVAKLIDSYLAEVARDANLSVAKFQGLAEELPEYARACDDGLYRAIDTYLKAHPATSEVDRKKLCRLMDCQKLSLDACMHAAQNERLPLRVVVQVLFCEQVKLRNAITGSALAHRPPLPHPQAPFHDASTWAPLDGRCPDNEDDALSGAAAGSPLLAARRDIHCLKLDVAQMKVKYSELQADYSALLQRRLARGSPILAESRNVSDGAIAVSAHARRVSGVGSALKKLVRNPGNLFHHHHPSRFSMDDSGAPVHLRKPARRWRHSIS